MTHPSFADPSFATPTPSGCQPDVPSTMLGGLSPAQFMRRYWQKKPLLIRGAFPGFQPFLSRQDLFAMAADEGVESRLIVHKPKGWTLKHGPVNRSSLPPLKQKRWTLLVQGVDLHVQAAHELLNRFRFVPDARLDDLMISWASDGGGVGPHFDSYDVFLLQAHGRRRWRIGRQKDLTLKEGIPLKVLAEFEPEEEFVLEPGDMLYLPPRYAHDGIAEGECMTYSIGFRAPARAELAQELLVRLSEDAAEDEQVQMYRDAKQEAVAEPGAIPAELQAFAKEALERALSQPLALERALGEYLTEPKPNVWFEASDGGAMLEAVRLDRRTRMMYDAQHIFINGESYRAGGKDATLMRRLANQRYLSSKDIQRASDEALELLSIWCDDGWAHACSDDTTTP